MPPSQPHPPHRRLQLGIDHIINPDSLLSGSLRDAQTQAAELRALHAAVKSMHHHQNKQQQGLHHQPTQKEEWRTADMAEILHPRARKLASLPFMTNGCNTGGNEYPIFTPSFEGLMFAGSNAVVGSESRRNSIDGSWDISVKEERLSYILDKSQRSLSTIGGRGTTKCSYSDNIKARWNSVSMDHDHGMQLKPVHEINTTNGRGSSRAAPLTTASPTATKYSMDHEYMMEPKLMYEINLANGKGEALPAAAPTVGIPTVRNYSLDHEYMMESKLMREINLANGKGAPRAAAPAAANPRAMSDSTAYEYMMEPKPMYEINLKEVRTKGRVRNGGRIKNERLSDTKAADNGTGAAKSRRKGKGNTDHSVGSGGGLEGPSCGIKCTPTAAKTVVPLYTSREFSSTPRPKEAKPAKGNRTQAHGSDLSGGNNPFRSWFSRVKKKGKDQSMPSLHTEAQKELEVAMAMDLMELKVAQANTSRDAARGEAAELKLEMEAMARKVGELELYCKGLREELFAMHNTFEEAEEEEDEEEQQQQQQRQPAGPGYTEFYNVVAEARVEVKGLCVALLEHLRHGKVHKYRISSFSASSSSSSSSLEFSEGDFEAGEGEEEGSSSSFQPPGLWLESLVHQAFFEHFENVAFHKKGAHTNALPLRPSLLATSSYHAYLSLALVPPSQLLSSHGPSFNPAFQRFYARKVHRLAHVLQLGHECTWPAYVSHAFQAAARGVWIVHQLALSFSYPAHVSIFRVARGTTFDPHFMEEMPHSAFRQVSVMETSADDLVKLMVMPGFIIGQSVIKCKVVC